MAVTTRALKLTAGDSDTTPPVPREGYAARRPRRPRAHSPCVAPFASTSASILASRVW
jgi:hypothetical protein